MDVSGQSKEEGPYGNTVVKTPNMNRLEKESMLLTVRNTRYRYIANLYPERLFNTPVRVSDYWKTWIKIAETDSFAKKMIHDYEHRPAVELYDMELFQ